MAIAAIPLVLFALGHLGVQRSGQDPHALLGHWSLMAAFAVSIVVVGLLGATTPAVRGFRH